MGKEGLLFSDHHRKYIYPALRFREDAFTCILLYIFQVYILHMLELKTMSFVKYRLYDQ